MKFLTIFQESDAYDAGYSIGYTLGKLLPWAFVLLLGYFIYIYFIKNKSKK